MSLCVYYFLPEVYEVHVASDTQLKFSLYVSECLCSLAAACFV